MSNVSSEPVAVLLMLYGDFPAGLDGVTSAGLLGVQAAAPDGGQAPPVPRTCHKREGVRQQEGLIDRCRQFIQALQISVCEG